MSPSGGRERLHKFLARAGIASRRQAEALIGEGRVRVDGEVAGIGQLVGSASRVTVDGRVVRAPAAVRGRIIAYHKPVGRICTRSDPAGRPTVFEQLPRLHAGRWVAVGRLDFNTSGLLLFTTDGDLANRLAHPSRGLDREYRCRVQGEVPSSFLERLKAGIDLDGRPARFESLSAEGGKGSNRWYRVVIREGRYREVRRMWAAGGFRVSRLVRIRYGPVSLPRDLRPGAWRDLDSRTLKALYEGKPAPSRTPSLRVHKGPAKSRDSAETRKT